MKIYEVTDITNPATIRPRKSKAQIRREQQAAQKQPKTQESVPGYSYDTHPRNK